MSASPVNPESSQFIKDYRYTLEVLDEVLQNREQIISEFASLVIKSAEEAIAQETALAEAEETPGWGEVPNYHPGALEVHDLEPYMHVVVCSDSQTEGDSVLSHQLLLSEPFQMDIPETGDTVLAVYAKRLVGGEDEASATDYDEPVKTVVLSAWGIAPTPDGRYRTDVYVEPYLGPEV
jgi:hypothetical protein